MDPHDASWHESALAEKCLPTAGEPDRPTTEHPVLVKRGGHNDVVTRCAFGWPGSIATHPIRREAPSCATPPATSTGWLIEAPRGGRSSA
jgi:hypothetical protein